LVELGSPLIAYVNVSVSADELELDVVVDEPPLAQAAKVTTATVESKPASHFFFITFSSNFQK